MFYMLSTLKTDVKGEVRIICLPKSSSSGDSGTISKIGNRYCWLNRDHSIDSSRSSLSIMAIKSKLSLQRRLAYLHHAGFLIAVEAFTKIPLHLLLWLVPHPQNWTWRSWLAHISRRSSVLSIPRTNPNAPVPALLAMSPL